MAIGGILLEKAEPRCSFGASPQGWCKPLRDKGGLGTPCARARARARILLSLIRSSLCEPGKGCVYRKLQISWVTVPSWYCLHFWGSVTSCEYPDFFMVMAGVPPAPAKGQVYVGRGAVTKERRKVFESNLSSEME